jgi:MFS family permease
MQADTLSRRTIVFVNIAHAFDHFVLLIYPTAVIAIAAQQGLDYGSLIGLATGAFVAFGLCSLPVGWIADRMGRRNMLAIFFLGYGASCFAISQASGSVALASLLLVLGIFSAIYHPVGSSMLVSHTRHLGRDLGWNGVWGNLGAASASAVTAIIAVTFGWRWAFVLPGVVCILIGIAFVLLVDGDGEPHARQDTAARTVTTSSPLMLLSLFAFALVASGMTFNVVTIALPKVIDERIGLDLPLILTGSLATAVFVAGALTQLSIGRLIDRYSLPSIFVGLSLLQPIGLAIATVSGGIVLLFGLLLVTAAVYGQVVVNDAMIARYIPPRYRARAYSVRYFLGFTAAGFAAPAIAVLHNHGGFATVLATTAAFGLIVLICALTFKLLAGAKSFEPAVPAE